MNQACAIKTPEVKISGIGVHSGQPCTVTVRPDSTAPGIVFQHAITKDTIDVTWQNVATTAYCTTLKNERGTTIATVEHLMSALRAHNIFRAYIEFDGPEVPIMDGSAKVFYDMLAPLGQNDGSPHIIITQKMEVTGRTGYVSLSPFASSKFTVMFKNRTPFLDSQRCVFDFSRDDFTKMIAPARTWGRIEDHEKLLEMGMAKGSSLENTLVLKNEVPMNDMRMSNECAAHKVLDAIGDLLIAGMPIRGHFFGENPGHTLNCMLVKKILSSPGHFAIERS